MARISRRAAVNHAGESRSDAPKRASDIPRRNLTVLTPMGSYASCPHDKFASGHLLKLDH